MSVNKVILLGRLGQDPELKHTPSGTAVCNFSLATSEYWVQNNQRQERTEWHRIVAWGKLAELCNQYLSKGRQAYIEGKLQTRSWDAQDGSKRYTTEVVATTVRFLGTQGQSNQGQNQQQQQSSGSNNSNLDSSWEEEYNISTEASFTSDDIPF